MLMGDLSFVEDSIAYRLSSRETRSDDGVKTLVEFKNRGNFVDV